LAETVISVSAALTEYGAIVTTLVKIKAESTMDIIRLVFFIETPPEIKMRSRSCAEKRNAPLLRHKLHYT
jgi:hypothetical protein